MIKPMVEPDELEQLRCAFTPLRERAAGFEHRDLHVLRSRKSREKMKRLENEPNLAGAISCGIRSIRQRFPAIKQFAASGTIKRAEQLQ